MRQKRPDDCCVDLFKHRRNTISRGATTSGPSLVAENTSALFFVVVGFFFFFFFFLSALPWKPEKNKEQNKTSHFSGWIFIQLARSHANVLVNNTFGSVYEAQCICS